MSPKIIVLTVLLLTSFLAYSQSQLLYRNSHWSVVQSVRAGMSDNCYITSRTQPAISKKHPEGFTYLILFHKDVVILSGEGIDGYFDSAKKITMQAGDNPQTEITANYRVSGIMFVLDILSGKAESVKIEVTFEDRVDTYNFPAAGFNHAYMKQAECAAEVNANKMLKDKRVHQVMIDVGN